MNFNLKNILLIILFTTSLFSQKREEIVDRHPNGVKKTIFVYSGKGKDEKLIEKLEYWDNENIKSSMEWKNGKPNGLYNLWDEEGEKITEYTYSDGSISFWHAREQKYKTVNVSSAVHTGNAIITAIKIGDMETFRICLSPRLKEYVRDCKTKNTERCRERHSLESLFSNWKETIDEGNVTPENINDYDSIDEYDGKWLLNDS